MHRDRLIKILIDPFTVGLVISAPILAFFLPDISRYRATVEGTRIHGDNTTIIYDDLDRDHLSEEINIDMNPRQLKILLFSGPRLIEQYNFQSVPLGGYSMETGDYDQDGLKELYLLTVNGDSILLSIINPFGEQDHNLHDRLIFHEDSIDFELDFPYIYYCGFYDYTGDGFSELVFSITSGFSKRPRSVYMYDIRHDSLRSSPLSAATLRSSRFCYLDGDSIPEILINTDATGNYAIPYPYLDHSSWLMVLNRDLQFRFPPVEFRGFPSRLITNFFTQNDSTYLVVLHDYYGDEPLKSGLYIYDADGVQRSARALEITDRGLLKISVNRINSQPVIWLLDPGKAIVTQLNERLETQDVKDIPPLFNGTLAGSLDVDGDGDTEDLYWGANTGELVIFRKNFSHPVVLKFDEKFFPMHISRYSDRERDLLYIDFEEKGFYLDYRINGWYFAKYPLGLFFYLLVSLLIMMVYRIQRYRAERHYQTQRRISELQILSLKNQIDPHFTFNILNSLGHLYTESDLKERSYELFVKYSRLLRTMVENSDRIAVSLQEELEFVKNYIGLEQLRSHPPFRFTLEVADGVNPDRTIPRMLIHTFVENSIKHGIHGRPPDSTGELNIRVFPANEQIIIEILDNGPGLTVSGHESIKGSRQIGEASGDTGIRSTGKGLKIIDELIGLFNSLEGVKIEYSMRERRSAGGTVEGTEVRISL